MTEKEKFLAMTRQALSPDGTDGTDGID